MQMLWTPLVSGRRWECWHLELPLSGRLRRLQRTAKPVIDRGMMDDNFERQQSYHNQLSDF